MAAENGHRPEAPIPLLSVEQACDVLAAGGVVAYPTEAVFGLGCDPRNPSAVDRVLALKGRDADKGLILIAADPSQLGDWLDPERSRAELAPAQETWPGPVTWVMSAASDVGPPVARDGTVAVRVSAHPVCRALCLGTGHPLVSTSANPAGQAPAREADQVRAYFEGRLDGIVEGQCGQRDRPSEIRDARTGRILRA